MAESVGKISLDLLFNTQPFEKTLGKTNGLAKKAGRQLEGSFDGAGGSLGGLTSAVKGFGIAAIAAFAVDKVINFGKECLNLGSNLNEVQNVVDVTFGSMNKQLDVFAKGGLGNYGLSETMAKKYMGTFGAMSKAFGFSTNEAYKMSAALTGLSGDVASFYNITQDEAYTKLKSIYTGETETLKDLGVVMTQNALDSYAMAKGYGKTTAKMTEQEKVALRLAFVQEKLSLATGDYSRTSGQWANQVRKLTGQWEQFKATMGQGFINLFTPIIKGLNWILEKIQVVAEAFKRFSEFVTGKKGDDGENGLGGILGDLSDLNNGAEDLGDNVEKAVKKIKKSVMGFDELHLLDDNDDEDAFGGILDNIGNAFDDAGKNNGNSGFDDPQLWQPLIEGSIEFKKKSKEAFSVAEEGARAFQFQLKGALAYLPELQKELDRVKQKLKDTFKIPEGWKIPIPNPIPAPAMDLNAFLRSKKKYQEPIAAPKFIPTPAFAPALDLISFFLPSVQRYQSWVSPPIIQPAFAPALDLLLFFMPSLWQYQQPISAPFFQPVFAPAIDMVTSFNPSLSLGLALLLGFTTTSQENITGWSGNLGLNIGLLGVLIATTFQNAWGSANNSFQVNAGMMTAGALTFITTTVNSFQSGLELVRQNVFNWGVQTQLNFQTTLANAKSNVYDGITNITSQFYNGLAYVSGNVLMWSGNVSGFFSSTMSNVSSYVSSGVGNAGNAFNSFTNSTGSAIQSWGSSLSENIRSIFENVVSTIQSAASRVWSNITGLIDKAKGYVNEQAKRQAEDPMLNTLWGVMKGRTMVPGASPVVPAMPSFGGALIPAFANGGYVKPNTPQLAIVGDNKTQGEFIAPEDKLVTAVMQALTLFGGQNSNQPKTQSSSSPTQLHLTLQLGDYDFITTVIDMINNETRRQGQPLIMTNP